MRLQKPDLRFCATLAILILTALCASELRADWTKLDSAPMVIGFICPYCISILDASTPISRAASTGIMILSRAMLISVFVFGALTILIRLWRGHHFAGAIRGLRLLPVPVRIARLCSNLQLAPSVHVILSEQPFAFCYGLLRPQICLSTGLIDLLTDAELKAVLFHEHHHQKTHAPFWLFLIDSFAAIFFFIPIFGDLRSVLAVSIERAADQYAVEQTSRSTLARALYRLLKHPMALSGTPQPAVVGLSVTSVRIAELLGERTPHNHISAFSLISSLAIILGVTCVLWPGMIF